MGDTTSGAPGGNYGYDPSQGDVKTWEANQQKNNNGFYQYMNSANNAGNIGQSLYNFFSNPFNGNNYSGYGGGSSGGSGLTNPLSIDFTDQYGQRNPNMTADVFNSMNQQEWAAFKAMDGGHQNAFIEQRKKDVLAKGANDKTQKDAQDKQAQYDEWRTSVMKQLQTYADKMNMSVADLVATKDTGVIAAIGQGQRLAGNQNLAAGMSGGGGLSTLNTQKAVADSANQYQMQRSQLGLQATGMLGQSLQQQYMNATQQQQYNQQMQLQMQQAQAAQQAFQYQQAQGKAAGMGGMLGGAIGGYFGGPQGAQAGYGIGSGIATQQYPSYGGYNYQYPSGQSPYPSQNGGGGGLTGGYRPNGQ